MPKIRVTLTFDANPMSSADLEEQRYELLPEDEGSYEKAAEDLANEQDAHDIGDTLLNGLFHEDAIKEAMAGSDIWVNIDPDSLNIELAEEVL